MSSRSFTVETRGQGALVFGGPSDLRAKIIKKLKGQGITTISPTSHEEIEDLRESHDLDYILTFPDFEKKFFESTIKTLISSGESTLISVFHESQEDQVSTLPLPTKTIIYSDYLGEGEYESETLESWIGGVTKNKTIEISGDGLEEISILGINDLTSLIVLAVLAPIRGGETYHLGNPAGISMLNLAYLVRTSLTFKIDLKFVLGKEGRGVTVDHADYDKTLKSLKYELIENPDIYIKKFCKLLTPVSSPTPRVVIESPTPVVAPVPESPKRPVLEPIRVPVPTIPPIKKLTPLNSPSPVFVPLQNRRKLPKIALGLHFPRKTIKPGPPSLKTIIFRGLFIALGLYLGSLAFTTTISLLSLKNIYAAISSGQLPSPSKLTKFSLTYTRANWVALTTISGLSKNPKIGEISLLLDIYDQSLVVFDIANNLSDTTARLSNYVFGSGDSDVAQTISSARLQAEELYQKLSLLDGSLPAERPGIISASYSDSYKNIKAKISALKRTITTSRAVLASTPDIIGLGGRRKYAVLFQNNMELRSTGGFIGSFAVLSFENGKLYDMPIYDVYDADGQLKGHVEPPKPIKDILGEANWYLRDSNFDPDFPTSARRSEWFMKKTLNLDLDGTIAVNVNTLSSLLSATGPLKIADYDETITEGNLYERAQFHAEVNFFPGSTQKKEFLSTVANTLFAKLPELEGGQGMQLLNALTSSVEEKNTLISLVNPTSDQIFETLGWNGKINDLPCPSTLGCYKDYAMVVDNNFGVNKANYFVKRNIEAVITLEKNLTVSHTLRIAYENTSTSTAWPAGAYKNYQRLYLPEGSSIATIKIDGKTLESKDYTLSTEHNKTVVAYLFTVPISSKSLVEVAYTTPQIPSGEAPLYTWYFQKQSGTASKDDLTVYLNYPMYLRPAVVSPSSVLATQQLKFDMKNDTDHRITVKFTK